MATTIRRNGNRLDHFGDGAGGCSARLTRVWRPRTHSRRSRVAQCSANQVARDATYRQCTDFRHGFTDRKPDAGPRRSNVRALAGDLSNTRRLAVAHGSLRRDACVHRHFGRNQCVRLDSRQLPGQHRCVTGADLICAPAAHARARPNAHTRAVRPAAHVGYLSSPAR